MFEFVFGLCFALNSFQSMAVGDKEEDWRPALHLVGISLRRCSARTVRVQHFVHQRLAGHHQPPQFHALVTHVLEPKELLREFGDC